MGWPCLARADPNYGAGSREVTSRGSSRPSAVSVAPILVRGDLPGLYRGAGFLLFIAQSQSGKASPKKLHHTESTTDVMVAQPAAAPQVPIIPPPAGSSVGRISTPPPTIGVDQKPVQPPTEPKPSPLEIAVRQENDAYQNLLDIWNVAIDEWGEPTSAESAHSPQQSEVDELRRRAQRTLMLALTFKSFPALPRPQDSPTLCREAPDIPRQER